MRHTSGVIGPVQNILRQPNLRLVELMGPYESFSVISQYFQNCSPTVRHLRLAKVTVTDTASIPSDLPPRRILLSHLSMSQTDGGWLRSPGCPFAFDNLTDLRIGDGAWPLSQHMLAPAFNSIQNLDIVNCALGVIPQHSDSDTFYADNGSYPLKIAHLPSLRTLKAHVAAGMESAFRAIVSSLSDLPPENHFHTLRILLMPWTTREAEKLCLEFDAAVVALPALTSLIRVEVQVGSDAGPITASSFPCLRAANKLYIRFGY